VVRVDDCTVGQDCDNEAIDCMSKRPVGNDEAEATVEQASKAEP
jgi:hypothetical protein